MKLSYNLVLSNQYFGCGFQFRFAVSFHVISCLTDALVESPCTDTLIWTEVGPKVFG